MAKSIPSNSAVFAPTSEPHNTLHQLSFVDRLRTRLAAQGAKNISQALGIIEQRAGIRLNEEQWKNITDEQAKNILQLYA